MKRLFLLLIINTAILFSAQFEIVKDVTELQNDLTAAKYAHKDVNGDWCSILKVHTDVKDLQFEGLGYEKHDYWAESGIYIVYLQPDTKNLRFIKDEFIALNHTFPFKLKGNSVYQIDMKGVGEEKKIENIIITIQTVPSGGEIYFDGKNLGFVEQIETGVGPHEIMIKRSGYEDKTTKIQVSAKNNYFKIELVPLPGTIQLNKIKPEVDYTKSGLSVSLETGIEINSEISINDTLSIETNRTPGIGLGLNYTIKISERIDALVKLRYFMIQYVEDKTSTLTAVKGTDSFYLEESLFAYTGCGIKVKLPKRIYLSCEAGITRMKIAAEDFSDSYDYSSMDFSYAVGFGYEYKRLDLLMNMSSYVTDHGVIRHLGLSAGYKFWIF